MRFHISVPVIAGLLLLTAVAHAGPPRGHGFSAWDFGQARAEASCPNQTSCFDTAFQNTGDTTAWAACYDDDLSIPNCRADIRAGQSFDFDYWTGWAPPCEGDCGGFPISVMEVDGTKDGDIFTLEGSATVVSPGHMELAVLHYTGNPTALTNVVVNGVPELVSKGIVSPGQILYSAVFLEDGETPISEVIPVHGIPISEIVIYGYGEGPAPPGAVPATLPVGLAALVLLVLAGFGYAIRR